MPGMERSELAGQRVIAVCLCSFVLNCEVGSRRIILKKLLILEDTKLAQALERYEKWGLNVSGKSRRSSMT